MDSNCAIGRRHCPSLLRSAFERAGHTHSRQGPLSWQGPLGSASPSGAGQYLETDSLLSALQAELYSRTGSRAAHPTASWIRGRRDQAGEQWGLGLGAGGRGAGVGASHATELHLPWSSAAPSARPLGRKRTSAGAHRRPTTQGQCCRGGGLLRGARKGRRVPGRAAARPQLGAALGGRVKRNEGGGSTPGAPLGVPQGSPKGAPCECLRSGAGPPQQPGSALGTGGHHRAPPAPHPPGPSLPLPLGLASLASQMGPAAGALRAGAGRGWQGHTGGARGVAVAEAESALGRASGAPFAGMPFLGAGL